MRERNGLVGRVRRVLDWVWVREGEGGLEEGKLKRVASIAEENEKDRGGSVCFSDSPYLICV